MLTQLIRMSPVEQDRVLLKHAGVITDDESKQQERRVTGRVCPNCHEQNSPTARYCNVCGKALDNESLKKIEIYREILNNPDAMRDLLMSMIDPASRSG